ncbi:MAG: CPA2 family monovalent cation:H+ antiporter-2 [Colwellia sp.]
MHGFFQGEHTDMSPDAMDRIEFANGIILTENSFANGHSIASLNLSAKRVTVVALRRNNIESEQPDEATILQAQDTLIVRGKPRRVERAERFVQKGV